MRKLTSILSKFSMFKKTASLDERIYLNLDDITLDEAKHIYFETTHLTCKSIYDFNTYFAVAFEKLLKNIPEYNIELSKEKAKRQNILYYPIEKYNSITPRSSLKNLKDFVVIDTETTGLKPSGNDIIELCAIKFHNFLPIEKFHSYLKPRKSIPAEATAVNHITDVMVANAPRFSEVKPSLENFLSGYPLVAHNAPFDMKFLHVSGLDLSEYQNKIYDTLNLSRKHIRDYDGNKLDNYKLSTICEHNNICCETFHTAEADTLACGILFVDIIKQIKGFENVNDLLI